jgi:hypothetical protein
MLQALPITNVHSTKATTATAKFSRFPFSSYSSPASPKIDELRARYAALHADEDMMNSDSQLRVQA